MSKGSARRPSQVSAAHVRDEYDRIFAKKEHGWFCDARRKHLFPYCSCPACLESACSCGLDAE